MRTLKPKPEPMTGAVLRSPCVHHWLVGPMEGPILHRHLTCTKCDAEKDVPVIIGGDVKPVGAGRSRGLADGSGMAEGSPDWVRMIR